MDFTKRPKRPFGVSLAIVVSIFIFTLLPLLEVMFVISIDNLMIFDTVGRSGMNVVDKTGQLGTQMLLQSGLALGFLIIAVIAWFGRPSWIRHVLSGAVLFEAGLTIALQIIPRMTSAPSVLDSSRDYNEGILRFYLLMTILITMYVVWYLNRWAARAFYRGYYLPEDIVEMKRVYEELNPQADSRIDRSEANA